MSIIFGKREELFVIIDFFSPCSGSFEFFCFRDVGFVSERVEAIKDGLSEFDTGLKGGVVFGFLVCFLNGNVLGGSDMEIVFPG